MYEQTKSILNDEYKGVSISLFEKAIKCNRMWGPEYIIFMGEDMDDEEIADEIDRMMFIRVYGE